MPRKPKLKAYNLRKAGYKYKLDELTTDELDEWQHGRKVIKGGKEYRADSTDYDYFYKQLDTDLIVRIYHVGGSFYYNGVKLRGADQLAIIEQAERDNKKYAKLQSQVVDTPPAIKITEVSLNTDGTYSFGYSTEIPATSKQFPDIIELVDGPLAGRLFAWNKRLPFFMTQYESVENVYGDGYDAPPTGEEKIIEAVRYQRDKKDHNKYIHDKSFFA